MPHYMIQFSYTSEAWAALGKNPENRAEVIRALVEKLGGRMLSFYYTFGKYDGVIISELPDNVSAAACSVIANAAGHLEAIETSVLMTPEEGMEVMRKVGGQTYQRPKG